MKKFARTLCVIMLSVVLGISCFSLTACPDNNDGDNANETRPLVFSVQELDNVFNPFFSSSGYDTEITGNTQVSMLTTDAEGKVYCGVDEPTVAQNYSQTIYYRENSTDEHTAYKHGDAPNLGDRQPSSIDPDDYYTTYQFLIKNNIKFSDGQDLTIKDVIFNLYTYLDPTYYGSSTIYSTAIKGLQEYRLQQEDASDEQSASFNESMAIAANQRLTNMRLVYTKDAEKRAIYRAQYEDAAAAGAKAKVLKDVETVRYLFWDEITKDYANSEASLQDYLDENAKPGNEESETGFTETWEIFLYNEGLISVTYKTDGTIDTYDVAGQGTRKDGTPTQVGDKKIDYADTWKWWHDKDSLIRIVFNEKMGIATDSAEYGNYIYEASKATTDADGTVRPSRESYGPMTDILVDEYGKALGSSHKSSETDATYWERLWNSDKLIANLYEIITYWATSASAREQFIAEEKQAWFENSTSSIDTIEGITVHKLAAGSIFDGEFGTETLTEDQYVLQIEIERVDPKAVWNFGFTVAPMHYYSNADNDTSGQFNANDDYRSFNYPGIDGYDATKAISVGRPFGSKDYLDKVVKASNIISVPVGAGMYKVASYGMENENYTPAERPTFTEFSSDNVVYYIRNPYFYTTSGEGVSEEESSICNCKIKYIRYQVITNARLLDSVLSGTIDYGDPAATTSNMAALNANSNISTVRVQNNGYGYIGVNATYVPDVAIRQAIMHAMDLTLIQTYYGDFASLIYRPISTVSWASPQNPNNAYYSDEDYQKQYYEYFKTDDGKTDNDKFATEIEALVKSVKANGGYKKDSDNVYYRSLEDGTKHRLEYTFTIAGASDDHPAYTTMKNAADILNANGFKITVKTDSQALSKLSAGTLTVWAAAWSSATDPDMYQVYHYESSATSVLSWGYPSIIAGKSNATYRDQYNLIVELGEVIEEARSVLDTSTRADYYIEAYDMVMDLAVELPTYQRVNIYAYNNTIIDDATINKNCTPYSGPLVRMWEVELK